MSIRRIRPAAVVDEWGEELVDGWRRWLPLSREVGDVVAGIVGAEPGEVVLCDSTLYTRYVDVHTGLSRLRDVVKSGRHLDFPETPKGLR